MIRGHISSPRRDEPVFAGLFPDRILEGRPIRYTILEKPGPYILENPPEGEWHLIAQSVSPGWDGTLDHSVSEEDGLCIGRLGPIVIGPGTGIRRADIQLRPKRLLDPPVLFALHNQLAATPA